MYYKERKKKKSKLHKLFCDFWIYNRKILGNSESTNICALSSLSINFCFFEVEQLIYFDHFSFLCIVFHFFHIHHITKVFIFFWNTGNFKFLYMAFEMQIFRTPHIETVLLHSCLFYFLFHLRKETFQFYSQKQIRY